MTDGPDNGVKFSLREILGRIEPKLDDLNERVSSLERDAWHASATRKAVWVALVIVLVSGLLMPLLLRGLG